MREIDANDSKIGIGGGLPFYQVRQRRNRVLVHGAEKRKRRKTLNTADSDRPIHLKL
jgi:hypothetical protein